MAPRDDGFAPLRGDEAERLPQPPSNIEAEHALLGAIFMSNSAFERVSDFLLPEHFSNAVHGRIYDAIGRLIATGQPANPVTLKNLFDKDGALAEIGGAQYLARLAESAVTVINAEHYGRTIRDEYVRRELITIGQDIVTDAFRHDLDDPVASQIERVEQKLYELDESGRTEGGFTSLGPALQAHIAAKRRAWDSGASTVGLATGFRDIDEIIGGLQPGELIILGARTSMGKSAFAMQIALKAARDGHPVGAFSLEMARAMLMDRILASETKIPLTRIRRLELDERSFEIFTEHQKRLSVPLYIDDSAALSVATMRARARRLKRRGGLGLVVVDYLQLSRPAERNRNYGRVQEVGEITHSLKAIAKDLDVPVLALSQLSRAPETREDKRPELSDLRESGDIEQDADVIMFLFREEYYLRNAKSVADLERRKQVENLAEVIIAKQRQGPLGTATLYFDKQTTTLHDYDPNH